MRQITEVKQLRSRIIQIKNSKQSIALVPTMGNLHDGHLSLVRHAQKHADVVIVSIFVNPTQFNNLQDLKNYPRTIEQDLAKLEDTNCEIVFTPKIDEMYAPNQQDQTKVKASSIAQYLCGAKRPGHFDGVVTIVSKLFNLIQPDVAIFGRKDFQQLRVIKDLVCDLMFPIQIIGIDCVREKSGLALSSRNNLLTDEQKNKASIIYQVLKSTKEQILKQNKDFKQLEQQAIDTLNAHGFEVDYFVICDANTLKNVTDKDDNLLIATAVFIGNVRLIDNIEVNN